MALWGGRFEKEMEPIMRRFNDSFAFDYRLYAADIDGSLAYASALSRAGLITEEELDLLCEGLEQVRAEFDDGSFEARQVMRISTLLLNGGWLNWWGKRQKRFTLDAPATTRLPPI